jgi:phosphatidylserine decarboxylase
MKRSWTKRLVKPFVRVFKVDATEFEKQTFESFNDFFTRRLKKGARPINPDPGKVVMPADGRYFVYPKIERIYAKGQTFDLETFLGDKVLAKRYEGGSMAIIRLCPVDYHRFHFPVDCVASDARLICGHHFSVSPFALRQRLSILWENKRMVTELETERFGKVASVEIGATNVGSIRQTYHAGKRVKKGDEKGYFEFGGSCIVLLFEQGRIVFDADLIENTKRGLETLGRLGDTLGS